MTEKLETEVLMHTETAMPSIRDLNYPITTMGHVRTYSLFPFHKQVLNNGKIRGQLAVARAIQGCIPLIYGPTGCAFQTKMCAMKPWDNHISIPCTDFTEVASILGNKARKLSRNRENRNV